MAIPITDLLIDNCPVLLLGLVVWSWADRRWYLGFSQRRQAMLARRDAEAIRPFHARERRTLRPFARYLVYKTREERQFFLANDLRRFERHEEALAVLDDCISWAKKPRSQRGCRSLRSR